MWSSFEADYLKNQGQTGNNQVKSEHQIIGCLTLHRGTACTQKNTQKLCSIYIIKASSQLWPYAGSADKLK